MKNKNKNLWMTEKSIFFNNNRFLGHPFFLFLFLSLIHIILLIYIYFNIKYIFLVILEFLFFLYFNKFNIKIILKIFTISFIIFLLNIFFYEGKLIYNSSFIRITEEGLINGLKKAGILIGTFFLTLNILKDNNDRILNSIIYKQNNNIFLEAVKYYLLFWKELGENNNIKNFFIKIVKIYKDQDIASAIIKEENIPLKKDFFIYHFVFFFVFILIYLFL